jgi:pullulanase/glycogen debranching enzyme
MTRFDGVVVLSRDWEGEGLPPLEMAPPGVLRRVSRMGVRRCALFSGYCFEEGEVVFVLWPELFPGVDCEVEEIRVAGEFNGWGPDSGWALRAEWWEGAGCVWVLRGALSGVDWGALGGEGCAFKFVTARGVWLDVPGQAFNRCVDGRGCVNFHLSRERTGLHVFCFVSGAPASLAGRDVLLWGRQRVPVGHGEFLLQQNSSVELGARVYGGRTCFRVFAPRASGVVVELWPPGMDEKKGGGRERAALAALGDGVWEWVREGSLHGWRYWFFVSGENDGVSTAFDAAVPVLDPWALAAEGPSGPGLVVDGARVSYPGGQHRPPPVADLVVVEGHVRDLVARVAGGATGFRELAEWIRSPGCYLRALGVNALELQPVQEFDAVRAGDYHWGYMPVNWFAPASAYARDAGAGSQIADFQDLVAACHEAGLAVIVDVVYNHVGAPNHLERLDRAYFFEQAPDGGLSNWSGCGNDVRARAPLVRRLVVESLRHWVECFDVDGFRFDLAELLGVPLLREVERVLRPVKPGLILIAEPWSFRGHLGGALAGMGFVSWNDGFREFFPAYVHGAAGSDGLRYFLGGSPGSAPLLQALNYTESHDDRCWLDRITENAGNDGTVPTPNDARRTRLMGAALFASLGVPMLAAGQDFLRSKAGLNNTYLRGDVNALDYARLEKFHDTHVYFRDWIAFRLSDMGAALRRHERTAEGFFRFFQCAHSNALGAWYNADGALAVASLFFAINPHSHPVALSVPGVDGGGFRQIANGDVFCAGGLAAADSFAWHAGILTLPALSAGLWIAELRPGS